MFLSLSHKKCLSIHPGLSKCIEEEILLITIFISRECTIYLPGEEEAQEALMMVLDMRAMNDDT